ncbi:MAG: beta-N-acetylglucosaminidase domain-containing protein [Symbiobacterium sp.]|uniref:beta-N-acetylglucosaminidase domain-containing protein n=1 Tax=Symbiobacterium sp. TaxID=1971213 RepID=UPI003464C183
MSSPFAIRGVIEGFYGRLWSRTERERMIDFLGRHGYNLYVYAPKSDPLHRNRWQEPYLSEELAYFAALDRRCREQSIQFVFGLSPLKLHYSDDGEMGALFAKLEAVYRLGVRSFMLLLDDMPDRFHYADDEARFGTVADAHVWLNNTVLARLEAWGGVEHYLFCPTEYCGEGRSPYLERLGEGLRPEVHVLWTGPEVCSPRLTTADARVISETLRRPVLYWENYPVNDLEMRWRPHIRPIRGRDADLGTVALGIVANAALQPEACKIPLHTYARYMADPAGYEPEAAWEQALLEVCGNEADARAVAVLADLARWSHLERGRQLYSRLAFILNDFWRRWGGPPAATGPDLEGAPQPEERPPAVPALDIGLAAAHGDAAPTRNATTASCGEGPGPTPSAACRLALVDDMLGEFTRLHGVADRILHSMANPWLKAELRPWAEKLAGWCDTAALALTVLRTALRDPAAPVLPALRRDAVDRLWATRENFHWVAGDLIDQFARRCLWAAEEVAAEAGTACCGAGCAPVGAAGRAAGCGPGAAGGGSPGPAEGVHGVDSVRVGGDSAPKGADADA